jgi:hypothetical protein
MGMGRRSKESLIAERLTTPFQKELFAAVIRSLQQLDNPLRANNFATGLRELSRIILAYLAPDADVKACAWFKPEIPNGSPTRSQRVKYAVQAGLMDDFVRNTLKVDVEKTIKRFTKLIERLSSLTHITENRFGMRPPLRNSRMSPLMFLLRCFKQLTSVTTTFSKGLSPRQTMQSQMSSFLTLLMLWKRSPHITPLTAPRSRTWK